MHNRYTLLLLVLLFHAPALFAQDDMLSLLGNEEPVHEPVKNAFKSSRVINGHSMEMVAGGVLDFRILHRFGRVNQGVKELFGLDQASMRMGFDYGITDQLTAGFGRSTFKKELDGFLKFRALQQSTGQGAIPFSIILISGMTMDGSEWAQPERTNYFTSRLAYYHQVILGRKFSEAFSLQLTPTLLHRNLVVSAEDPSDLYALGAGARVKLTKRIALTADYFYNFNPGPGAAYRNPLSIGFDIETGGHVFQLHFSNTRGMNERAFLANTEGQWEKGDIQFGFNLSRVFTLDSSRRQGK